MSTALTPDRPRRRPAWVEEVADVIDGRRWLALGVAVVVSLVGIVTAVAAPHLLPATPLVGAAVGLAACLLAVAAAVAVDAADPTVRGERHVRAAGASLAATVLGSEPSNELVDWAEQHIRGTDGLRLALASAGGSSSRTGELTDRLGAVLARRGWRVLVVDLSREHAERAGAAEVCRAEVRLSQAVELHPSLNLARLGSGRGFETALHEFPALAARLPRDVDTMLVALPNIRRPGVLPAAAAADRALALTEEGATTRVDLIAALDALDEARVPSDVVLLRDEGERALLSNDEEPSATEQPTAEVDVAPPLFDDTPARQPEPDLPTAGEQPHRSTPPPPPHDEPTAEVDVETPAGSADVAPAADEPLGEAEGDLEDDVADDEGAAVYEDPDHTDPMTPVEFEAPRELRIAVTLDALERQSRTDR